MRVRPRVRVRALRPGMLWHRCVPQAVMKLEPEHVGKSLTYKYSRRGRACVCVCVCVCVRACVLAFMRAHVPERLCLCEVVRARWRACYKDALAVQCDRQRVTSIG